MKSKVNFKILEQSLRLASKASDLERQYADADIAQLLHEVNLMALGIPKVISSQALGDSNQGISELLNTIKEIRKRIDQVPVQSEALFEFARLLDQESELVLHYQEDPREIKKPHKVSRLSIQDRGRAVKPLSFKAGYQVSLF